MYERIRDAIAGENVIKITLECCNEAYEDHRQRSRITERSHDSCTLDRNDT